MSANERLPEMDTCPQAPDPYEQDQWGGHGEPAVFMDAVAVMLFAVASGFLSGAAILLFMYIIGALAGA